MKYREYMEDHPEENVTWCKPYTDSKGNAVIMLDGSMDIILFNGRKFHINGDGRKLTFASSRILKAFAQALDPYYDQYSGYTDTEIILQNLRECGCASCPFRGECELMGEEIEE